MASKNVKLPMSQGGLQTFHEKIGSEFTFSPDKFVFAAVAFVLLMIILLKLNPLGF